MPFSSTRIEPNLALDATAIFSPVAAGLGDGLATEVDGLLPPHAAASRTMPAAALVTNFDCISLLLNLLASTHPIPVRVTTQRLLEGFGDHQPDDYRDRDQLPGVSRANNGITEGGGQAVGDVAGSHRFVEGSAKSPSARDEHRWNQSHDAQVQDQRDKKPVRPRAT